MLINVLKSQRAVEEADSKPAGEMLNNVNTKCLNLVSFSSSVVFYSNGTWLSDLFLLNWFFKIKLDSEPGFN